MNRPESRRPRSGSAVLRDLEHSLPMQLLRAREAAMARFRPMLRLHGLTEQQWRVIRVLAARPDLDATALARNALLLAPSLTRIVQSLEQRKLVRRRSDASDQRRAVFGLTAAGANLFDAVAPDSERLYADIAARFGAAKLATLYDLLAEFSTAIGVPDKS